MKIEYGTHLNSISYDYLREVKDEKALKEAAESWGIDPKKELYKLPAMYVGNYAETRCRTYIRII